jgi:DNA-binding MarR family transcriptional regulator
MTDEAFRSKVAFIVETDGLLKNFLESIVIKKIKSDMTDDRFKNLTSNHVHAALIIKNISPCALKKFASVTRMSGAAASALVDRMVKAGVVQRKVNPENRREILLTISSDFEAHVSYVRSEMIRWFETLAGKIGMESFEKWYNVMVDLHRVLQEELLACHTRE